MGFGPLRVINEDYMAGGSGFSEHQHDHFEILSVVLTGALRHRDSAGNSGVISAGGLQLISAGTGISHSEYNASADDPVHFFQVWLHGTGDGTPPRYQTLDGALPLQGELKRLAASPTGAPGTLRINAAASIWIGRMEPAGTCTLSLAPRALGFLQLLDGVATLVGDGEQEDLELRGGDGLQLAVTRKLRLLAKTDMRYLWFDIG
jgi:redox-sensitive bicupin YhaK (pirin superfamily)